MTDKALEVHKALADDTRFRLYRYLRNSGRPVSVRELSASVDLHPNTLRPHLRRLEDAGLVRHESPRSSGVGRPQTLYSVVEPGAEEGGDFRLVAEILAGVVRGARSTERAEQLAREWGSFLVAQDRPKPGVSPPARRSLAVLQDAMSRAGFDPRFRRSGSRKVEVTLRDCPARDLTEDHRDLICALHRGLIEGMLQALSPPFALTSFEPLAERTVCRVAAKGG